MFRICKNNIYLLVCHSVMQYIRWLNTKLLYVRSVRYLSGIWHQQIQISVKAFVPPTRHEIIKHCNTVSFTYFHLLLVRLLNIPTWVWNPKKAATKSIELLWYFISSSVPKTLKTRKGKKIIKKNKQKFLQSVLHIVFNKSWKTKPNVKDNCDNVSKKNLKKPIQLKKI